MIDVAILGGGSAGYAAARTAVAAGLRVAVVEGGEEVGGLCILRGCMPSKALLYAADVLHQARRAKVWGLRIPKAGFDFKAVMARKNDMVADFANFRRQQLVAGKFKFIRGRAEFIDSHTISLSRAANAPATKDIPPATLRARHFIICTGSITAPSPVPHLNETGYITSDDALALRRLPKSLLVLGGGPVAVELAQFFSRFGVKITLLQRGEHLLRQSDTDAAIALEQAFRREGIRMFTGVKFIRAFQNSRGKGIEFEREGRVQRVVAEEILLAFGRSPNTAHLRLENAGVKTNDFRIPVNLGMRTNVPHIFAAGDCAGPHEIVHIAVEQGEIAAHNIAFPKKRRCIDYRLLTTVTFTDPQVASVGLTEKEARARKIPYRAASHPFDDHGKSMIMDVKEGFVKLLANPRTGEIIGGACVGPMGGELIHEIIAAMRKRMTVKELAAMPHYHPTLAEIWTYPAGELAD